MLRSSLDLSKRGNNASAQDGDPPLLDAVRGFNAEVVDTASDLSALVILAVPSDQSLAGRVSSLVDGADQPPAYVEELNAHVSRTRDPECQGRSAPRRIPRGEARPGSLRRAESERELGPEFGGREAHRLVDLNQPRSVGRIVETSPKLIQRRLAQSLLDQTLISHPKRHEEGDGARDMGCGCRGPEEGEHAEGVGIRERSLGAERLDAQVEDGVLNAVAVQIGEVAPGGHERQPLPERGVGGDSIVYACRRDRDDTGIRRRQTNLG